MTLLKLHVDRADRDLVLVFLLGLLHALEVLVALRLEVVFVVEVRVLKDGTVHG